MKDQRDLFELRTDAYAAPESRLRGNAALSRSLGYSQFRVNLTRLRLPHCQVSYLGARRRKASVPHEVARGILEGGLKAAMPV